MTRTPGLRGSCLARGKVELKDLPRQELRHLQSRSMMSTHPEKAPQVSTVSPHRCDRFSPGLVYRCLVGGDTDHARQERGEPGVASGGMRYSHSSHHLLAPGQDRWNPELGSSVVHTDVSEGAVDGFGSLKRLIGAIVVIYSDQKVRPCHPG